MFDRLVERFCELDPFRHTGEEAGSLIERIVKNMSGDAPRCAAALGQIIEAKPVALEDMQDFIGKRLNRKAQLECQMR